MRCELRALNRTQIAEVWRERLVAPVAARFKLGHARGSCNQERAAANGLADANVPAIFQPTSPARLAFGVARAFIPQGNAMKCRRPVTTRRYGHAVVVRFAVGVGSAISVRTAARGEPIARANPAVAVSIGKTAGATPRACLTAEVAPAEMESAAVGSGKAGDEVARARFATSAAVAWRRRVPVRTLGCLGSMLETTRAAG